PIFLPSLLLDLPPPPRSPLFPYTTLFRSLSPPAAGSAPPSAFAWASASSIAFLVSSTRLARASARFWRFSSCNFSLPSNAPKLRSEEHTSELQSRGQLVCRLLLETKKKLY